AKQFQAIHFGHLDIDKDDIIEARCNFQEGVIAIAGLIHLVSFGLEHHGEIVADVALVIDNQNVNLRLSHRIAPFANSSIESDEHQTYQLKKPLTARLLAGLDAGRLSNCNIWIAIRNPPVHKTDPVQKIQAIKQLNSGECSTYHTHIH